MSRGESYGGGKSSLGYLFGSDPSSTTTPILPPSSNKVVQKPPWGDDNSIGESPRIPFPSKNSNLSNKHHKTHEGDPTSGNKIITDRPSTKVRSVPGGDSTLGYLFGDNSI